MGEMLSGNLAGRDLLSWEHDNGQPEEFDGADDHQELLKVDGFGDVAVGVEVVAAQDVLFGAGTGEDNDRYASEVFVIFDFGEDFASVFSGQIEVKEDDVRARGIGPSALAPEEFHRVDAVFDHVDTVGDFGVAQGLEGQFSVTGTIFDEEDFDWAKVRGHLSIGVSVDGMVRSGREKKKVEPCPGCDSTQIAPPWRSTIFLQMARPMPVPA